jgi:putative ABC transport system permease protein
MLKGYLKMAFRVLKRSAFFTGVSLFGISFTLAGLMLIVAFLQNQFGSNAPMHNADGLVYLMQLEQRENVIEEDWVKDSTRVNGAWVVDSSLVQTSSSSWMSKSAYSLAFLENYITRDRLTTAQNIAYLDAYSSYDLFKNNRRIKAEARHVDAHYFEIFNFEFIEGRALNEADIRQGALHAVISSELSESYFGSSTDVVGQSIVIDNTSFEIKGVLRKANINNEYVNGDLFLPITFLDPKRDQNGHFGMFCAIIQSKNNDTQATLDELKFITSHIPFLDPSENNGANFNFMKLHAANHQQYNALDYFYHEDPAVSLSDFTWAIVILIGLFCAVPLVNLMNLNISRIIDRSAEIGVRKAFGAHSASILTQVITENVVLTLIGGVLGLGIALGLMAMINEYQWLNQLRLFVNFKVFFASLAVTLVFGVLSGYLPALKMAKASIVESLKYK